MYNSALDRAVPYHLICDTWDPAAGDFTLDVTIECPTDVESTSWGRIKTTYR